MPRPPKLVRDTLLATVAALAVVGADRLIRPAQAAPPASRAEALAAMRAAFEVPVDDAGAAPSVRLYDVRDLIDPPPVAASDRTAGDRLADWFDGATYAAGRLVVTATPAGHAAVSKRLAAMRLAARAPGPDGGGAGF